MMKLAAVLLLALRASAECATDDDCCVGVCQNQSCVCSSAAWMGPGCCTLALTSEPINVITVGGKRAYGFGAGNVQPNLDVVYTTAFDEDNGPYVFQATRSFYSSMRPNSVGNADRPYVAITDASEPVLVKDLDGYYHMLLTVPEDGPVANCSSRIGLASTNSRYLDPDNWRTPWSVNRTESVIATPSCASSPTWTSLDSLHYIAYSVSQGYTPIDYTASRNIGVAVSSSVTGPYTVITEDIGVKGWQPRFVHNNQKLHLLVHTENGIISALSHGSAEWNISNNIVLPTNTTGYSQRIVLEVDESTGVYSSMLEEKSGQYIIVHETVFNPTASLYKPEYSEPTKVTPKVDSTAQGSNTPTVLVALCSTLDTESWYNESCFSPPISPNDTDAIVILNNGEYTINTTEIVDLSVGGKGCQSHVFSALSFHVISNAVVNLIDGTLQGNFTVDETSVLNLIASSDWSCSRGVSEPLMNSTTQAENELLSCADLPVGFSPRVCGESMVVHGNLTASGMYASVFTPLYTSPGSSVMLSKSAFLWGATENRGTISTGTLYWHTVLTNEVGGVLNIGQHDSYDSSVFYSRYPSEYEYPEAAITNHGDVVIHGGMRSPPVGIGGVLVNEGNLTIINAYLEANWQIHNLGTTYFERYAELSIVRGLFFSSGTIEVMSGWVSMSHYLCSECLVVVNPGSQLNFMASSRPSNKLIEKLANPGESLSRLEVCTDGLCSQHMCPYPVDSHAPCTTTSGGFGVLAYNDIPDRFCYACEIGPSLGQRISSTATRSISGPTRGHNDDDRSTVIQSFTRSSINFSNGRITGGGRVVCSVPITIEGITGLELSEVSVFSTVEHGLEATNGHGPIKVGKSATLSIGIDSVLSNTHISVATGGIFHVDSHSEVRAVNATIHVPKGSAFRVDGTLHLDDRSKFNVCGETSGVGTLHFTSASAREIDEC
eukprot:TRINITY_DN2824_c2_g1_i1.p1 TRINITY_DN2824_c2_g1~~TRINITY_DN2824_c2_g1_i1.p1  ORF type:complete len:970 (+),score=153.74 TRINITY_DN2824_c2_g1_i1:73-2910(+)